MEAERGAGGPRDETRGASREQDEVEHPGDAQARLGMRHVGRLGEQLAAEHLVRRGFAIVQRNYRTRWGEIDIVACDGRTLVFCEVKSRRCSSGNDRTGTAATAPFDSLHQRKRAQVRKMAASWMSERSARPYVPLVRFDAIGVTFDRQGELVRLEHVEGAF